MTDWQQLWFGLNERQQAYLTVAFFAHCEKAEACLSSGSFPDDEEWCWTEYHESRGTGLEVRIRKLGLRDADTDAAWETLEQSGYLHRRWTWVQLIHSLQDDLEEDLRDQSSKVSAKNMENGLNLVREYHRMDVKLTSTGMQLCLENAGRDALLERLEKAALEIGNTGTEAEKRAEAMAVQRAESIAQGLTQVAAGYDVWVPAGCIDTLTQLAQEQKEIGDRFKAQIGSEPLRPDQKERWALHKERQALESRAHDRIRAIIEAAGGVVSSKAFSRLFPLAMGNLGEVRTNGSGILSLLPLPLDAKQIRLEFRRVFA